MTETGIRPARHSLAAGDGANAADSSKSRLAMRLWALLHAQALLRGTIGGAGGALNAEDDRWRLAAHRETTHRRWLLQLGTLARTAEVARKSGGQSAVGG
jgi:hypothetical protein